MPKKTKEKNIKKDLAISIVSCIVILVLLIISLHFSTKFESQVNKIAYMCACILYIIGLLSIMKIDKNKHEIYKGLLLYEIVVTFAYRIYLLIFDKTSITRYAIYLGIIVILLLIETLIIKKKFKTTYTLDLVILIIIMSFITEPIQLLSTAVITLIAIALNNILSNINKSKKSKKKIVIPYAYYLCFANILSIVLINFLAFK